MQIEIVGEGVEIDAFARSFVRTAVAFATWHHEEPMDRARVVAKRVRSGIRCSVGVARGAGAWVCETATADALPEAVQSACDRLEVALHREIAQRSTATGARFAA